MWWGSPGFEWFLSIFSSDGLVVLFVEQKKVKTGFHC